ncbi:DUF3893 domain-containing protein [Stagnimonas aquatica]|uniref:DUF3893 domain-containing protein n=1 Tax=Stagnimonas aquatica TaxID=2689987 RepID=A0A3N0VGH2_9GAMM|nr:RNaseH domain-containing protein [Stagnimonas aquatica]ROH91760.1 DUF3893 domain-containing protein [Stagnimonas aquatica]
MKGQDIVLALKFDLSMPPHAVSVAAISWSPDALRILAGMRERAVSGEVSRARGKEKLSLPYASLRASLLIADPRFASMDPGLGLRQTKMTADPFGYLEGNAVLSIDDLQDAAAQWIQGRLSAWAQAYGVSGQAISQLTQLIRTRSLFSVAHREMQAFPWGVAGAPTDFYKVTAGQISRLLAGKEVFPGLGPMLRVVGDQSNSAELFSRPQIAGKGRFSLGCRISLETLPGARQPVVYLRFFRRRWASGFEQGYVAERNIGGFVLSEAIRPHEAFSFNATMKFEQGRKIWRTDEAFDELVSHFGMQVGYANEQVVDYPNDETAEALLMYKAKVTTLGEPDLGAGVSATDQLDATHAIVGILEPYGFRIFDGHSEVKKVTPGRKAKAVPRLDVFKPAMILNRLFRDQGEQLEEPVLESVDEALRRVTQKPLSEWFSKNVKGLEERYEGTLAGLVSRVVEGMGVRTDPGRRNLYLLLNTGESSMWIKAVDSMMVGDEVKVTAVQLPPDVHGPRNGLPGSELNSAERFQCRVAAWRRFIESNEFGSRPMFLVQAADFYPGGQDDSVNKVAAVRTLSGVGGGTVQYLLPPERGRMDGYLVRLQSALLDLRYGHAGCVMGLKAVVEAAFPDMDSRPQFLAGIGYIRIGERADLATLVATARIEVATGKTCIKLAHLESEAIVTTWMTFDEALGYVAGRGRLTMGDYNAQKSLISKLLRESFDSLSSEDANAVVFVDATNMARFWPMLTNPKAKSDDIVIDGQAFPKWNSLRLIRVRENAPMIVHQRSALFGDRSIEWATPVQRLIEAADTVVPTYWSIARTIGQFKRGTSCYRSKYVLRADRLGFEERDAEYSQHQTPNPIELAVLRRQLNDDPTVLAGLGHHLRAGIPQARGDIWVKMPSPLHVLEKIREYLESY